MKNYKEKLNLKDIGPSLKLYHYKRTHGKEESVSKKIQSLKKKYIFCFNLNHPIKISIAGEKVYDLFKYHSFICHDELDFLEIKLDELRNYEFILILVESQTIENIIKDSKSKKYPIFLQPKKLRYTLETYLETIGYLFKIARKKEKSLSSFEQIGLIYIVLNITIKHYIREITSENIEKSSLNNWEKKEIENVSKEIQQSPAFNFTLNKISEKTGICIPRLQIGFKEMHNMTVANFIREIRIKKAEKHIRESEKTISEVVYSIGFSSRSYFSKIFKQKYGCTPSEYKKRFHKT